MKRYSIDISYDGTAYSGWQVQPNDLSVQEVIEKVLLQLNGATVKIHGSGRTDQGVHAKCQVAHFDLEKEWVPRRLYGALNALLPDDIRIRKVQLVAPDFHARRSAKSKEYRYYIWNGENISPFDRLYKTHIKRNLDVERMRAAAKLLEGEHDFKAFTASSKTTIKSTVRTIFSIDIKTHGNDIDIRVKGSGFLYKMVRSIVGWLIEVGDGSVEPDKTTEVLASCKRTSRVPTAKAKGLFLWKVNY